MADAGRPPFGTSGCCATARRRPKPPWGGSDRERPLTARGRRDATALGARLADDQPVLGLEGHSPTELIICSAAVRTRQTADLIAKAWAADIPIDAYRSLYGADPDLVLRYVREIDEGVTSALMVGHNPACTNWPGSWWPATTTKTASGDAPPSRPTAFPPAPWPC